MAEVASAYVSLLPSARGFGSKLSSQVGPQVDGAGKTMGSRFGKMFALAGGALAAAGIGRFFKGAIEEASGLEEVGTKINAIFGEQGAKSVQGFAAASATAFGQSKLEALDAAATFGTFGKAAGLGGVELANFSAGFVRLSTDLASFNNSTPEEATLALGAALRGESEPIRRFGVLLDDATLRNEALKLGLIETTKDALTPQQKVLAAQAAIYKQTSDAQGDFARTSGGLANQQRILSAQWTDMKARIGSALLPAVTQLVTFLNSSALPVLAGIGAVVSAKVAPAFAAIGEALGPLASSVRDLVSNNLEPLFAILSGMGGAVIAALAGSLGGVLVGAVTALASALASPVVLIGALVGAAVYAYQTFDSFRTAIDGLIASIRVNFLPVLQTMATTFTTSILPAVTSLVSYLAAQLFPVFVQIAGVISNQVLPIVASLAQFLYGTVYPAIIAVARSVASSLRPVFEQLVATFRGSVLPAIQQILAKFREWQPTIQKVIGVLLNLSGQAIAFAAVILGKVLPPVIRFAGFILSNVVPAILAWIGVVGNIIGKLVSFGKAVIDRVQDFAKFASGVRDKVREVVQIISALPGTVLGLLSTLAGNMYDAGVKMVSMLASGIRAKASDAITELKNLAGGLAALIPGSPVKKGPLRSLNNGHAGKEIMALLAKGITAGTPKALEAMKVGAEKLVAALSEKRDKLRSVIDGIKSDMANLASSIASAFSGNLFNVSAIAESLNGNVLTAAQSVGTAFMWGLQDKKAELTQLLAAFKKLKKWGVPSGFLSQLFASGNSALILEMAAGSKSSALAGADLFGDVQSLSAELGGKAAQNQYGGKLDRANERLERVNRNLQQSTRHLAQIEKAIKRVGDDVAKALDKTASTAARSA